MSEVLQLQDRIAAAWRAVAFVSELTGLSIGVLIALAAMVYLDPALRKIAVRIAIAIFVAYGVAVASYRSGISEKQAEWDEANRSAAAARDARDDNNAAQAKADAAALGAQIISNRTNEQRQLDALIQADAVCHPISADELR